MKYSVYVVLFYRTMINFFWSDSSSSDDDWDEFLMKDLSSAHKKFRKRRFAVHPVNLNRKNGEYYTLCRELHKYPDKFFQYCRMSQTTFNYILSKIRNGLQKDPSRNHRYVQPEEQLFITLRYLH